MIRARILNVHDLPAVDAVYHQTCSVNFRTNRKLPKVYEVDEQLAVKKRKVGRPQDKESNWPSVGSCCDGPAACARLTSTVNRMQLLCLTAAL